MRSSRSRYFNFFTAAADVILAIAPITAATAIAAITAATAITARADTIEFPEEELATETVLPVFERTRSVLNRNVQTEGRFEIGAGGGMSLNEPFYSQLNFNLNGTYHFSEMHAANLAATFFMAGVNNYSEQLKRGEAITPFDPSKAPAPTFMVLGNYQFNAYYGKISLSKQAVMNLSLFGLAGAGVLQTGSESNIALDVGFGQNFYFSKNLAMRIDLKLVMFNGPDATSLPLDPNLPAPDASQFDKEIQFKTYLSLGLVYLL